MGISLLVFVAIVLAIVIREARKPKIAIPSMKPKRTGLLIYYLKNVGIHFSQHY